MSIDYSQILLRHSGQAWGTLGEALSQACDNNAPGDDALSPLARYRIGKIGDKVNTGEQLTPEEIKNISERVGKIYVPGLVFLIYKALGHVPEEER